MPAAKRRQSTPRPASSRKIAGRTTSARAESGSSTGAGDEGRDRRRPSGSSRPGADKVAGRTSGKDAGRAADTDSGRTAEKGTNKKAGEAARPGRRPGVSKGLAAAGIVVGLLAGGAGAYLATSPGLDPDNAAFVDSETTDEVAGLAATNAQRLVAIDHSELDAYHASLDEFLAPQLVEELDETWDALSETYEQTRTVVDAQTQNVGVSFLTEDRAEVLLVINVSMTRDGVAAGSTSGTYLVEMTRMDGTWKLSSIPDLPS